MIAVWVFIFIVVVFGIAAFTGAPYVPSKRGEVDEAFRELYPLGQGDVLLDIGSGDGMVLRAASKFGAKAVGYEINPILVAISKFLGRSYPGVETHMLNFWTSDFPPNTTVVYTFGDSRDIAGMGVRVQQQADILGRPLFLISFGFDMPGKKPLKEHAAYFLYRYTPRQHSNGRV